MPTNQTYASVPVKSVDIDAVTVMLILSIIFLLILLISGTIKTYKLKAENDRLSNLDPLKDDYDEKKSGHLYEN